MARTSGTRKFLCLHHTTIHVCNLTGCADKTMRAVTTMLPVSSTCKADKMFAWGQARDTGDAKRNPRRGGGVMMLRTWDVEGKWYLKYGELLRIA